MTADDKAALHEAALREVTTRWLYDAEFHAKVERAVNATFASRRGASTRVMMREAVALALVLEADAFVGEAGL